MYVRFNDSLSGSHTCQVIIYIAYSWKLPWEKTFANFTVLWLFTKVFSSKFGGMVPFARQKRAICESFLLKVWGHGAFCTAKARNLRKFSPQSLGAWCLLHGKSEQSAKVFSSKFGGIVPFAQQKQAICESLSAKSYFSPIPSEVSCYTVCSE